MIYLALGISIAVSWFVLNPLLRADQEKSTAFTDRIRLVQAKDQRIRMLKELEFDLAADKVSPQEYQETKASLYAEVAVLIEQLDRM